MKKAISLDRPNSKSAGLTLSIDTSLANHSTLVVDRKANVIRNVSIITAGEALGHDFGIDATTVRQVADAINANPDGIPSRMTHAELDGVDPIRVMAGKFRSARVEGDKVYADFYIGKYAQHSPEGNLAEYLLGLAEDAPEAVGTSIHTIEYEFSEDGMLRVLSLANIDWVGTPAANPNGMLSAKKPSNNGARDVPAASSAKVNGVTMKPDQIAFLTSIGLAAGANDQQVAEFVAALSPEQKTQLEAVGVEPTAPPAVPAPATLSRPAAPAPGVSLATLNELNDIATLADLGGDWAMQMAIEGVSLADARKRAKDAKAAKRQPIAMSGSGVQVGVDLNLSTLTAAVSDALALKSSGSGYGGIVETDPVTKMPIVLSVAANGRTVKVRPAHERTAQFQNLGLLEMGRQYLVALGAKHVSSLSRSQLASLLLNKHKFRESCREHGVNLAQSTTDFSHLLADSMGKTLRQAYVTQPATWPLWARKATAPDFKTIKRVQLSEAPTLTAIPEGDEYEFGTVSDGAESYVLTKYGKGLRFTWQSMVNDDLDSFSRLPMLMGRSAARIVETTAVAILTANAALSDSVALFATAHANLTTGVPSVTSLGAARAALRKQTPLGGTSAQALGTMPKGVLVPEALAITMGQLVGSQVDPAKNNATPNPFMNSLTVVSSPQLDASSAIIWYMFGDPNEIDTVEVGFLEGEEGPVVEEEIDFSSDDLKLKVRQTCNAKAIDYRGLVRSSGA